MTIYSAPVEDFIFIIEYLIGADDEGFDGETLSAILEEAGKLASTMHSPADAIG